MQWMRRLLLRAEKRAALPPGSPWDGQPVDIEQFWADAWRELHRRQAVLASEMGLANAQWEVDQQAGLISFERSDGALLTAPVQIVGSWNPKSEMFTWGWNHPSVMTRLRMVAERTRWFGDKHKVPELVAPQVKVSEADAWRLTAVAVKVNGASGAYRGPTEDGPVVFMALGDLKVRPAPNAPAPG